MWVAGPSGGGSAAGTGTVERRAVDGRAQSEARGDEGGLASSLGRCSGRAISHSAAAAVACGEATASFSTPRRLNTVVPRSPVRCRRPVCLPLQVVCGCAARGSFGGGVVRDAAAAAATRRGRFSRVGTLLLRLIMCLLGCRGLVDRDCRRNAGPNLTVRVARKRRGRRYLVGEGAGQSGFIVMEIIVDRHFDDAAADVDMRDAADQSSCPIRLWVGHMLALLPPKLPTSDNSTLRRPRTLQPGYEEQDADHRRCARSTPNH